MNAMSETTAPALLRFGLPLGVFLLLVVLLAVGLNLNPREVPSPLIDKPAPAFELPQLHAPDRTFAPQSMKGQVWILNVWASWCAACRDEHPVFVDLARRRLVPLIGLNYKDQRADALAWLKRFGDPYGLSAADLDGRVGIDYGVYGVPETYVIDKQGVIRYKRIGPVTPQILETKILPLISELNRG
ncbi:MAG: thiol:disulfide interchange protein [Burkholderiales bacterium]|jgi:cytochrome c biogenesis protein CcmG/thiol:disulfide interchange protein DsbE|nr:thiol:disulfide interchange protein [Burkholderiales bacterium]